MSPPLVTWPATRLAEALEALARHAGHIRGGESAITAPDAHVCDDAALLGQWITKAADQFGLDAEFVHHSYGDVASLVAAGHPTIIMLPTARGEAHFIAATGGVGRHGAIVVLDAEHNAQHLHNDWLAQLQQDAVDDRARQHIDQLLDALPLGKKRAARTRTRLLAQHLQGRWAGQSWVLRPAVSTSTTGLLRRHGLVRRLAQVVGLNLLITLTYLAGWWLVGRVAFEGRFDRGWFIAWALMTLSVGLLQAYRLWTESRLAIGVGGVLREQVLNGLTSCRQDELRRLGTGGVLARIFDGEAIESLAIGGGFTCIVSGIELIAAGALLLLGAGGGLHLAVLAGWVAILVLVTHRYMHWRTTWTAERIGLTNDLTERMIGHRTMVVQGAGADRHEAEDLMLAQYLAHARRMDRVLVWLTPLGHRGWLLFGTLALVPALVAGHVPPTQLALSVGGILLAFKAIRNRSLTHSFAQIASALLTWRNVRDLLAARQRREDLAADSLNISLRIPRQQDRRHIVVDMDGVAFRYPGRSENAVERCVLQINSGDAVLLQGESGHGKSTLVSVMASLLEPSQGVILLHGLDRQVYGSESWRRLVLAVPPFDRNHLFAGTLAFNLLFGKRWPACAEDLVEAEGICKQIGLGPLLDRMPRRLHQRLGRGGWQLSHGELNRLFIARALLQRADLVLLDESFETLDPASLEATFSCAMDHARSLLVTTHPQPVSGIQR